MEDQVEGTDVFGDVRLDEICVDKDWGRSFDGEVGLSVAGGKKKIIGPYKAPL